MDKLKQFLKTSLLGGMLVILPVAILASVTVWVFNLITGWISPLTRLLTTDLQINEFIAESFAIILILSACFFIRVLLVCGRDVVPAAESCSTAIVRQSDRRKDEGR